MMAGECGTSSDLRHSLVLDRGDPLLVKQMWNRWAHAREKKTFVVQKLDFILFFSVDDVHASFSRCLAHAYDVYSSCIIKPNQR